MFFVKLLVLGGVFIISNGNLALHEEGNLQTFGGLYFEWVGSLIESGKSITGYVVDVDWLPRIDSDPLVIKQNTEILKMSNTKG